MASHDHPHIDAGQRGVVQVGACKSLRHKPGRRRESRRVVVSHQIVVNRFRDMKAAQRVTCFLRFQTHNAHRVAGVVAADVEEMLDLVSP
jgi:hypothetical protein